MSRRRRASEFRASEFRVLLRPSRNRSSLHRSCFGTCSISKEPNLTTIGHESSGRCSSSVPSSEQDQNVLGCQTDEF